MKALIVTEPFANYAKGDQITAPDKITAAEASNPHSVVAVELSELPIIAHQIFELLSGRVKATDFPTTAATSPNEPSAT